MNCFAAAVTTSTTSFTNNHTNATVVTATTDTTNITSELVLDGKEEWKINLSGCFINDDGFCLTVM